MTNFGEPKDPNLDFDAFLDNASEQVAMQNRNKILAERIQQDCDDILDLYEVPCIFRFDQQRFEANYDAFILANYPIIRDDAHMQNIYDEDIIMQATEAQARMRYEAEDLLLTKMLITVAAHEHKQDEKAATESKKEMMAMLNVQYGAEPGSSWMQFATEFLPGEPLDFSAVEDVIFLDKARQKAEAEQRSSSAIILGVQETVASLVGDDAPDELKNRYFEIAYQILGVVMQNDVERDAAVDEYVRQTGIPRDHLIAIRNAMDEAIRKTNDENE